MSGFDEGAARAQIRLSAADFEGQAAAQQLLRQARPGGGMPHAALISGEPGTGKRSLADLLCRTLLCAGEDKPCGVCPACLQLEAGTHPDRTVIRPGEPIAPSVDRGKKIIPVDDIREAVRILSMRAYEGAGRVLIIEQAEQMNPSAQNALLKTLEEPPEATWIMLLSASPGQLLPTIRSRCWQVRINPWPESKAAALLRSRGVDPARAAESARECGGSLGRALEIAGDEAHWARRERLMRDFFGLDHRSDIVRISGTWKDSKDEAAEMLDGLENMVRSLLLVRLGQADASLAEPFPPAWRHGAQQGEVRCFVRLLDALSRARARRASQVTWQAAVERLLLDFMEVRSQW